MEQFFAFLKETLLVSGQQCFFLDDSVRQENESLHFWFLLARLEVVLSINQAKIILALSIIDGGSVEESLNSFWLLFIDDIGIDGN